MDDGTDPAPPTWPEETIPILRVTDAAAAVRWYRRLGFEEEWTHRFHEGAPAFTSIRRGSPGDGVRIFLSEHRGDAQPNGLIYLRVADVDAVRALAAELGAEVHDAESRLDIGVEDPDGNRVRLGAPTGRAAPGYTYPSPSPSPPA